MRASHQANLLRKCWFTLRVRSSRMVDCFASIHSALHSPYFVERTSVKTICNCFHPRSPAFGAKAKRHEPISCLFVLLSRMRASHQRICFANAGSCYAAAPVVWSIASPRYTRLCTLPTLWRKLRRKQYSIVSSSLPSIRSHKRITRTTSGACLSFYATTSVLS